jgi:hypothetical protein
MRWSSTRRRALARLLARPVAGIFIDEIAWTITWSGDIPIAIIFSKEHAAQAAQLAVKTDLKSPLYLCVNLPEAALFRSIAERGREAKRDVRQR